MGRRDGKISGAIARSIQDDTQQDKRWRLWKSIKAFFALYGLLLIRLRPGLFRNLRSKKWGLSEDEYKASFKDKNSLVSKGDMGYSGSVCAGHNV
jgi:hypothetical protein